MSEYDVFLEPKMQQWKDKKIRQNKEQIKKRKGNQNKN